MIRTLIAIGTLVWAAVGFAATIAIARSINIVQCPDRAPLDLRDALYVEDILVAADL